MMGLSSDENAATRPMARFVDDLNAVIERLARRHEALERRLVALRDVGMSACRTP
jgi:hypothetical protein